MTSRASETALCKTVQFCYCGYAYDKDTGLYYLQSRYYDPEIGRFISADAFVSTGQGILGNNMFAYCGNNPINCVDRNGESVEALDEWLKGMSWLPATDGPIPASDIVFILGALVFLVFVPSSSGNHTTNDSNVTSIPIYTPPPTYYEPPPSTTYGRAMLQAETFAIRREQAKAQTNAAVTPGINKSQYYAAELVSGQVVPLIPLSYSTAKLHALAGGNILCVNHAAAYALVKNIPSARWDGRHGSAESGYLNHYHLSSAHDNHIWYLGE